MKIVVTGGSGFIGQHVLKGLLREPEAHEVISIDLVEPDEPPTPADHLTHVVGDIRDPSILLSSLAGADSVIHLAAVASVPASVKDPRSTHETNATGTLNVLEAARANNVSHVTVASSSAVYGEHPEEKKHEHLPVEFLSPYASSKGATEGYALAYGAAYSLKTVAFRFFNVFGPGQTADHPYAAVIPRFLAAIRAGTPLQIYGDGGQTRDFVSVHTVADALIKASTRQLASRAPVNIASGTSISINELVKIFEEIHGAPLEVKKRDARPGDIRHSGASVLELKSLFPDLESQALLSALEETYHWYQS